jgi:hypothetical protein
MPKLLVTISSHFANWLGILCLLAILVLCLVGFKWRSQKLCLDKENKLLDARLWYSQKDVQSFLGYINTKLGKGGLNLFALTQVTLDLIFPITYGIFFATLITLLYSEEMKKKLIIIPFLATIFDLGENFILAYLAYNYSNNVSSFARFVGIFTSLKWLMTVSSVLLLFGGAIYRLL